MTRKQIEAQRLERQTKLDAERSAAERNELGQFATPPVLAGEIVAAAMRYLTPQQRKRIRFLDPAIGTGAFYSALLHAAKPKAIEWARGVEMDERFIAAARELWADAGLEVTPGDFTAVAAPAEDERANLLIANPPYVRHHHLDAAAKSRLKRAAAKRYGMDVSGLAGLYVHFMLLSHDWMADDGVAAWLIPSEWMDVNYGRALKEYLTRHVTLLEIHLFDAHDVQFGDALVSSTVVYFRRATPEPGAKVRITAGGGLSAPARSSELRIEDLAREPKWSEVLRRGELRGAASGRTVGDLFKIRRGIATGSNPFFIRPLSEWSALGIPTDVLRPVLPPSRLLSGQEIGTRADGYPDLPDPLGLLDTDTPEETLRSRYPRAWEYLSRPEAEEVRKSYLARHRDPWYSQEKRPAAPFVCTYMGRGRNGGSPFRIFWNRSAAIVTNGYLMLYPQGELAQYLEAHPEAGGKVAALLQDIAAGHFRSHGRVYGGGLHKLEPKELASLPAGQLLESLGVEPRRKRQTELALK